MVIIDSSLGWLGQRSSTWLQVLFRAQLGDVLGQALPEQQKAPPSTKHRAPLTSNVCYVSSQLIARRAYVDLLVDFYTKLSYLSYNYETTWLRIRVRVCISCSQQFSHMNRSLSGPQPHQLTNFDSDTFWATDESHWIYGIAHTPWGQSSVGRSVGRNRSESPPL